MVILQNLTTNHKTEAKPVRIICIFLLVPFKTYEILANISIHIQ